MEEDKPETQIELNKGDGGNSPPTRVGADWGPRNNFVCMHCSKLVHRAHRALPYMNAYVCFDCARADASRVIAESEISNKVVAPWTNSQVISLNDYQRSSTFLPFSCPRGHALQAHESGYRCQICSDFTLSWTYPWVLDGTWKKDCRR